MEYHLSRNYGHFTVTESTRDEFVSVIMPNGKLANMKFGGVITAMECVNGNYVSFRFNPSYRDSFNDNWTYTSDEETLQAYISNEVIYILVDDDRAPILCPRKFIENEMTARAESSNVISLFINK